MGDQTHVKLYSKLLEYLDVHGRSLAEYGSAERGLNKLSAIAFLDLLRNDQIPMLGVELWRSTEGRMELDVSEIWYSESTDLLECHLDAGRYMNRIEVQDGDVFTIQFG